MTSHNSKQGEISDKVSLPYFNVPGFWSPVQPDITPGKSYFASF
jgi:hypothetical protein